MTREELDKALADGRAKSEAHYRRVRAESIRREVDEEMAKHGESLECAIHIAGSLNPIDAECWHSRYTIWTASRVYFRATDGHGGSYCCSAPRNPCDVAMEQI